MKNNKQKGKWANEISQLKKTSTTLKTLERDVASTQQYAPQLIIKSAKNKMKKIEENVNNLSIRKSFFDSNLDVLNKKLRKTNKLLENLEGKNEIAETIASEMSKKHDKIINRVSNFYNNNTNVGLFVKNGFSIFENAVTSEYKTWNALKNELGFLSKSSNINQNKENILSLLLVESDEEFIENITNGTLTIGAEIGHLVIQRINCILADANATKKMKSDAKRILETYVSHKSSENLFYYDNSALQAEITKLGLHAELHPDKKVIWLGTAKAVKAFIDNHQGEGTYLNCDDKKWTWELNRAWLQAAAALGYEFKLVEQHFPAIEEAILSQNAARLIEQLSMEIRAEGVQNHSQYNGGDSPTATPQEILVLMSMGCIGQKNDDGTISFHPPVPREEPQLSRSKKEFSGLARSHSSPNLFKAAPPPPLKNREELFARIPSSVEVRASQENIKIN